MGGTYVNSAGAYSKVVALGYNSEGQLGNGTLTDSDVPVTVTGTSGVTEISAGAYASLALMKNGTVVAWGRNEEKVFGEGGAGELGDGTTTNSDVPVPVCAVGATAPCSAARGNLLTGVTEVSAGSMFNLALLSSGKVVAWGDGYNGELGNAAGGSNNANVPVPVCAVGQVQCVPPNNELSGVTQISAGWNFSLARLANGTAVAWGEDEQGNLGNGNTGGLDGVPVTVCAYGHSSCTPTSNELTGVAAVSADGEHSLALLSNETVMSWGSTERGQLGNGTYTGPERCDADAQTPCDATPVAVCAVGVSSCTPTSNELGNVKSIKGGLDDSLAVLANGTVVAWGDELGNGTFGESAVPVVVVPGPDLVHVVGWRAHRCQRSGSRRV